MKANRTDVLLRFGAFELDLSTAELRKSGVALSLPRQPLRILALLASRPGQLVTREQIRQEIWGNETFVDFEQGLNFAINKIRASLADNTDSPRFIETLPRRGYRFIAPVEEITQSPAEHPQPKSVGRPAVDDSYIPSHKRWSALRKVQVSVILALLLVVAAWGVVRWRLRQASGSRPIRAIAVLPLTNFSGDASQDYFADGMTDELITDLAKIGSLKVISRTSSMRYQGSKKSLQQIARELEVDAIVEGSVARSANKVRITAQLIDAVNDRHLWAESYERDLGDVLGVQNTVALEIARQVRTRLTTADEQRMGRNTPVNPDAYDEYLRGRYAQASQSGESLKASLPAFQQAIALDPTFARAYAGLADTYSLLANYGVLSPSEAFPQAEAAARKALQLDPDSPEAHTALAYTEHHYTWQWAAAERAYRTAITLSPSYATVHLRFAEYLSSVGRHDEAIAEMRRSVELDPLSLAYPSNLGRFLYHARRYDEAIEVLQKVLDLDANRVYSRIHLAMCYEEKGMFPEAAQQWKRLRDPSGPGFAHFLARTGDTRKARELAGVLRRKAGDSDWFFLAGVYAALGDKNEAFACLENAYEKHDFFLVFLTVHPFMDPLRSDPRYAKLVHRMGLS